MIYYNIMNKILLINNIMKDNIIFDNLYKIIKYKMKNISKFKHIIIKNNFKIIYNNKMNKL